MREDQLSIKVMGSVVEQLRGMARRYSYLTLHKVAVVCLRLGLRALDRNPKLLELELRAMAVEKWDADPRKGKTKTEAARERRAAAGEARRRPPRPRGPVSVEAEEQAQEAAPKLGEAVEALPPVAPAEPPVGAPEPPGRLRERGRDRSGRVQKPRPKPKLGEALTPEALTDLLTGVLGGSKIAKPEPGDDEDD